MTEDKITIATWKQANFKTSRLELDLLLSTVTGRSRAEIIACPQMTLSNNQVNRLNDDLRTLEAGTPFAYIVGKKEFFGIELEISESVLVPRPETELLVEMALKIAPKNAKLLDLGTGSGAIALAIAKERPDIKVSASDLSTSASSVPLEQREGRVDEEALRPYVLAPTRGQHLPAQESRVDSSCRAFAVSLPGRYRPSTALSSS